jgi:hypothetical protein
LNQIQTDAFTGKTGQPALMLAPANMSIPEVLAD